MIVTCETDTGIEQKFFVQPTWDLENNLFIIKADKGDLPVLLTNLKEWVRQIELEVGEV